MKHTKAVVAATAAAVMILAGCSSGGSATEGGSASSGGNESTISFMGWGSDTEIATFNEMIGQYEAAYPGVKVEYITVPSADFTTKLQTMMASGQTPDVFYLNPDYVVQYADAGALADMTDFIANNDLFDAANIWPAALESYQSEGKSYALPKDVGPWALAYNTDLFAAAGIEPATAENLWTWDDFETAAKKLTSGSGTDKVYGTAAYSLESAVWSNGADWLSDDLQTVTVTDPKFVEALQWVADLSLVDGVAPSAEEEASLGSTQRFLEGKMAMMGIGPWSQAQLWEQEGLNWDIMPWPVSPNTGDEATWYGGIGFAVSSKSENLDAAMNLAAFLSVNEDAQRTNMEMGQAVPNLIDMAETEYLEMDQAPANKQEFLRILTDYGRRPTQTKTYDPSWYSEFSANVSAVYSGDQTAEEFTAEVQPTMQKALDESIAKQNQG